LRENRLHDRFRKGKAAIGTFVNIPSPEIVEILGWNGVDFIVIDTEHSPISLHSVGELVRAAEVSGMVPIVRVPSTQGQMIFQALDAGALGIQVPQVMSVSDARSIARAVRYNPTGLRGLAPLRSSRYGLDLGDAYFQESNREVLAVVQIESPEALRYSERICKTEGIDVIFAGPMDLSIALGAQGNTRDPKVLRATKKILRDAHAAGKIGGIAVGTIEEGLAAIDEGFQYVTVGSDMSSVGEHARRLGQVIRERFK